jgi:serine/threonine-protein kinase RsbW
MRELHEHIVIGSKDSSIRAAEKKLKSILDGLHLASSEEHNLLVAASEAVNNAVVHGNKKDPAKKVLLDINCSDQDVVLEVQDEGRGFNPKNLPNPLLPENLLKPSGRGIHIMKSLMDRVNFDFTSGGTTVIMELKVGKNKSQKG